MFAAPRHTKSRAIPTAFSQINRAGHLGQYREFGLHKKNNKNKNNNKNHLQRAIDTFYPYITSPPMSSSPPTSQRPRHQRPLLVAVQICDKQKRNGQIIQQIRLSVLEKYTAATCHLIEPDHVQAHLCHLRIRMAQHAHVGHVEIAGLTRLLSHWAHAAANPTRAPLPRPASLADGIVLYRGLQLLLQPAAEPLRARLMQRLRARPVAESDVQTLWWAFQGRPEWRAWLDALMYNVVRFHVLAAAPQGTAICLFVEAELLQLDHAQASCVLSAFCWHARATRPCLRRRLWRGVVGRVVRRVFG